MLPAMSPEPTDDRAFSPATATIVEPQPGVLKRIFGPVTVAVIVVLKFLGKAKFIFFPLLKTGGTMILTIAVYSAQFGWRWATGFVLLLAIHECGHLLVARRFGLKVGAPMFIPFVGAFIALKELPRNAWVESCVGIGGPILGALAAFVCHLVGIAFGAPLFIALAWSGYFLNLFNLAPVGFLDGGRIATALSPWLWIPGFAIMGWFAWQHPSPIIWIVLLLSLPRIFSLFRAKTDDEKRYFEITPNQRGMMAAMFFTLIGLLAFGMNFSQSQLANRGIGERSRNHRVWQADEDDHADFNERLRARRDQR